jgi:predicted 3-demethylubiquinone-9 3-methyltransferase (glyoxalase superfamily)
MATANDRKVTPFLMFNDQLDEAISFYLSVFPSAKVIGDAQRGPDGKIMSATFEIEGQQFMAYNGGPHFSFSEGISLFVSCKDQQEVDRLWNAFTSGGGEESMCGRLKDKFGVSWQIIPTVLMELLSDPDPERAQRATQAMLRMHKIDIAELQRAAGGN